MNPREIASFTAAESAYQVDIFDNLLYVAGGNDGLIIWDVSDPVEPQPVGACNLDAWTTDFVVSDTIAYAVGYGEGLFVIDISDPTSPTEIANLDMSGQVSGLAVEGDYAYVSVHGYGMRVVDISDPVSPVLLGSIDMEDDCNEPAIAGDYAFLPTASGLAVIDISEPTTPTEVAFVTGITGYVQILGSRAYVSTYFNGESETRVIDISEPANPQHEATIPAPLGRFTLEGTRAYVPYGKKVYLFDFTEPLEPAMLGSYRAPGFYNGIQISGQYAFLADDEIGLRIFDISDPVAPELISSCELATGGGRIVVAGDYAYVCEWSDVFHVVDISDLTSPVCVGSTATPDMPWDFAVAGDYAYIACGDSGVFVVDISDPENPEGVSSIETPDMVFDVEVQANHAYAVGRQLNIYDISDPLSPVEAGYSATYRGMDIRVEGNIAYLAAASNGFELIFIGNPGNLVRLGRTDTIGEDNSVDLTGNYACVAFSDNIWPTQDPGIKIIDVSDPSNPIAAGYYRSQNVANRVVARGTYVYAAEGAFFTIYDISAAMPVDNNSRSLPTTVMLHPAYPNPFNPTATIRFDLPEASAVTLTIYNLQGQTVETLVNGQMLPGVHTVTFDGSRFSSGSYFYTLKTNDFVETKQMTLVK
ncbi:T9SS type A sorting domain-containing protein [bacterium]|nr:T9SS type A sorting domain-containing protein [bacterium]